MAKVIDPSRRELEVVGAPQNLEVTVFNVLKTRVLKGRTAVDAYIAATNADPSTDVAQHQKLLAALAKLGFHSHEDFFKANERICYLEFLRCFEQADDNPNLPEHTLKVWFRQRSLPGMHLSCCQAETHGRHYHESRPTGETPTFDYEWRMPKAWTLENEPVVTFEDMERTCGS